MEDRELTRRDVLGKIGAAGVGAAAMGQAAGAPNPDEYNIGIRSAGAERAARQAADSVSKTLDWENGTKTLTVTLPEKAASRLQNRPGVRYVEPNGLVQAHAQTIPWGIDRVDADEVIANGETGGDNTDGEGGADIAVLDTGIDADHPDLESNLGAGKAYVECKGGSCVTAWDDDNSHGTHCAGTADAADNSEGVLGVSSNATLHAVKVLDSRGSGSFADVADGLKYTADQGWDVASMSLGASSGSSAVKDAVGYAYSRGVLIVASAGNSGPCSDCVGYPAAYSEVIAVSSTTSDDTLSDFSSTGPEVELAAPGSNVYSTLPDGDYGYKSGTSMSCPHVSGAGAQLMDNGYTNTEARDRLKSTAEDIGLGSNESGAGLLDVGAAVDTSSSNNAPTVDSLGAAEVETSSADAEFDVSWSVSDSDGNLSSVDITLLDDTDAQTEDTASVSVSGDSASGTTRVVAADDEGSGNSYTVELTVTDGSGASDTAQTSVSESESTNSSPAVESLSASEVETSDGDAEFDVSWSVSDSDGNLSSVDLTLVDDTAGATDDTASVSVSGDSASGTTRLVAASDDGSGNSYTVEATVTDSDGATSAGSTAVSETEDTNAAPTASIDSLTNNSNPAWTRYEVDWSATDGDGNLDAVVVEMLDSSGTAVDSASYNVSGSSAGGLVELQTKGNASDIVVTATDTTGASDTDSRSV